MSTAATSRRGRVAHIGLLALLLGGWVLGPSPLGAQADSADSGSIVYVDPAAVVTPEACGECHVAAYDVWKKTPHATGFKTLHRQENASAIAERMGFELIKRDSMCLDCHYTPVEKGGIERATAGVSCESCHGGGLGYLDVHNDYGGKDVDHRTESAEHRRQRLEASVEAGLRRPSNLYAVAANCYGCHMVPRERLVNVGRHSLGSGDFELATWTQGIIRHNFLDSFLNGDGTVNAERPLPHRRRLLVIGRALALEFALRGLAEATEEGVYLKAMQRRLRGATSDMRELARAGEIEEAQAMVDVVRGVEARLGQRAAQLAAADRISELAQRMLDRRDGTRLAMLDPLLEGGELELEDDPDDFLGEDGLDGEIALADGLGSGVEGGADELEGAEAGTRRAVPDTAARTSTRTSGGASPAVTGVVPAVGEKRTHVRPRSSHDTLEAAACQKCHGDQNAWWFQDRHYSSVEPFLDRAFEQSRIARLYGISPAKMGRGDSLCMDCHGTVASQRRGREVEDGVSCQSCHGPGADYLEPHQEGELSQGLSRPGFVEALELGMKNLHDLRTAVGNCASCHYVTDPRLLSSGHPSGIDFDIVAGMQSVQHWRADVAPAARLRSAWSAELAERGAVPQVRLASLGTRAAGSEGTSSGGGSARRSGTAAGNGGAGSNVVTAGARSRAGRAVSGVPGDRADRFAFAPRPAGPRTAGPRTAGPRTAGPRTAGPRRGSTGPAGATDLPALPEVDASTSIEEVLLETKRRLEVLYGAVAGTAAPQGGDPSAANRTGGG